MRTSSGIYVEIEIQDDLDHVWLLTQDPAFHERWDLRFSRIHYLPQSSYAESQQFLYETRIGFGLSIMGTGESIGQRASPHRAVGAGTQRRTHSLSFGDGEISQLQLREHYVEIARQRPDATRVAECMRGTSLAGESRRARKVSGFLRP